VLHTNINERGKAMFQWWIAIIAVLIMAGGLGGIYYLIIKQNAAIGTKTIQFLAIVFILPLLLILGIMNVLGKEIIGTLLGVIVGYVLSGFGKE
jgi:drug/metabolite transporter (DMT)-like permease